MADRKLRKDIEYLYEMRLKGVTKALTRDADRLYKDCSNNSSPAMCLEGLENGEWQLTAASEYTLPVPAPGVIRYRNDQMRPVKWLKMVARCSDAWLLSLVWYHAVHLTNDERAHLVRNLTNYKTAFEAVKTKKNSLSAIEYREIPESDHDEDEEMNAPVSECLEKALAKDATDGDIFELYKRKLRCLKWAVSVDVKYLYNRCSAISNFPLCLDGLEDCETWDLFYASRYNLPVPSMGIMRYGDSQDAVEEWLKLLARCNDAKVFSLAWFCAARLNKPDKLRLVDTIARLTTAFEVVRKSMQQGNYLGRFPIADIPNIVQGERNPREVEDIPAFLTMVWPRANQSRTVVSASREHFGDGPLINERPTIWTRLKQSILN